MNTKAPLASQEYFAYLDKIFKLNLSDIKVIMRDFHSEMEKGLAGYESSLKMIPAFTDRPKGSESGKFLALDLGGTNLRVLAVELDGKGKSDVLAVSKFVVPKEAMQGTGKQLFDFIANSINAFLQDNELSRQETYDLAFTFSFPVEQTNIATGKLIQWTKGFTAKGVEGEDVIMLLNEALKRKGIKCIKVAALANDTVGTLVAKCYNEPSCDIGVILGTGTNACYPEKVANIQKWRGLSPKGNMIINMEWGGFDKLRVTAYDKDLDEDSPNPGYQYLEKMVSGMYLGEITRRILCDLINRKLIFSNTPECKVFDKEGVIETKHMALIEGDNSSNLGYVEDFLTSQIGLTNITLYDKKAIRHICSLVSTRAAKIAAAAISAVLTWRDPELNRKHTVGIDGSLYEKYPGFHNEILKVFDELFKDKSKNIKTGLAKDGSGKGAAIIAAVAASSEK